jgi:phage tail-like protein
VTVMDMRPGRRGHPDAVTPFPLEAQVPAMLAEDPMIRAFLAGLDEVWAPIVLTLDCFYAYLDPRTAPLDMVAFLGSWIRADEVDTGDEARFRADVANAHALFAMSGTAHALREYLVPREAESVDIDDPGTTLTSVMPTNPQDWIHPADPTVRIRVRTRAEATDAMKERIRATIRGLTPAHVVLDVTFS